MIDLMKKTFIQVERQEEKECCEKRGFWRSDGNTVLRRGQDRRAGVWADEEKNIYPRNGNQREKCIWMFQVAVKWTLLQTFMKVC